MSTGHNLTTQSHAVPASWLADRGFHVPGDPGHVTLTKTTEFLPSPPSRKLTYGSVPDVKPNDQPALSAAYNAWLRMLVKVVRIRDTLWYEPAARDSGGGEIPAKRRVTVQAFYADGKSASWVHDKPNVDDARRTAEDLWPGVPVDFSDDRAAVRQAYRRHGVEIPE